MQHHSSCSHSSKTQPHAPTCIRQPRQYRWRSGHAGRTCAVASPDRKTVVSPFNVVITGASKGIGKALAAEFLRLGDSVVLCSRAEERIRGAVSDLNVIAKQHGSKVKGRACNMSRPADVTAFADYAARELGTIDIWINNAGSNAYKYKALAECSDADLISIVETNVLGTMLGCKEAIRIMREQPSGGHIFNMDGAGADGSATPRFAAYGATKRGLAQLGKSLQAELKMLGITSIGMHNLSPGMCVTDLLMSGADTQAAKFFINCLAEEAGTVAEHLVPRIRKVPEATQAFGGGRVGSSAYVRYLTKQKAYLQILARLLAGKRKNRWVPEDAG